MPCILVVRPEPAASLLAARLKAEGLEAVPAPVSEYIELPFTLPDLAPYQGLAFTSAEAVRVFSRHAAGEGRVAFCVGDATAEAARDAGFPEVRSADGDAGDLAALLGAADIKKILHISGSDLAQDMAPPLAEKGIALDRVTVYTARLLDELPSEAAAALGAGEVTAAMLFSARAAARFVSLLPDGAAGGITALCISPRAAAGAAGANWKAVHIAEHPRLDAMAALARALVMLR
jgi:uroporphyrinogen-III synthase